MPPIPVSVDHRLAEEAVLAAIERRSPAERRWFHGEREPLYAIDPAERETRFRELHARWFGRLALARPLADALAERPLLAARASACLVVPARSRQDENADLYGSASPPTIVVQLCAGSLLDRDALLPFLRHELLHVADMLDPRFGYDRELPALEGGPARDALIRRRYHALWDVTIEGRLSRQGLVGADTRTRAAAAFVRVFPMLGDRADAAFARWFGDTEPTHRALADFVLAIGERPDAAAGPGICWCPICRFPTSSAAMLWTGIPDAVVRAIARRHMQWGPARGVCRQCVDLFEAGARVDPRP